MARAVHILRIPQEPERVTRADPVVPVVFGIAVAGHNAVARGEGFVHLRDEVLVQEIVRIKEEEPVIARERACGAQSFKQEIERIALADMQCVKPLKDGRAPGARDCGGAVRAVVSTDVNIHEAGGVPLRVDAFDQVADDGLLIAGTEDRRIAAGRGGRQRLRALDERHQQVNDLICKADAEQRREKVVDAR